MWKILILDLLIVKVQMKPRYFLLFLSSLLVASLLMANFFLASEKLNPNRSTDFYVGIDAAYDDVAEIKVLVDEVSSYTNLFVIGSTGITFNETKLVDLCQYIYDKGLSFIVFTDDHDPPPQPSRQWIENAKVKWGDLFLGLYVFDEVGGKNLDLWTYRIVREADNYTDASIQFVAHLEKMLEISTSNATEIEGVQAFTSDYALYWFDYRAGYDVVFAEFALNYSRRLNVAACRGAATIQNREWGVMITWKYTEPPYLSSGEHLYENLVMAYDSGAKYVLVFDSNEDYTDGTLQQEHFDALKRFWRYKEANPKRNMQSSDRVAFVLPKDYGYGLRGPTDRIWGLWEADAFSLEICTSLDYWMDQYPNNLDIIYDDGLALDATYSKYVFWNNSAYVP